jgi:hypothetical protein
MSLESTDTRVVEREYDALRAQLESALTVINRKARQARRLNTVLVLVGILSGALVTLLGADAAWGGTRVTAPIAEASTGRTPAPLAQGWKNVCAVMAILAFIGTVSTGASNGLRVADRNARAFACAGILDGLLTELPAGAHGGAAAADRARTELARVKREYPEYFR